jgi:hypothetical protein
VFNIEIYFEQKLPLEDMDCLLEIANYHPGGCKKYKKGLVDISWKILDGAIVVASRDHATKGNGFWGGNIVGKELGEFTNNRSGLKKYILKATVERSAPELAITNPCLKISAEIKTWEAVRVEAFGFFLLAIIFSIISLVFLVIWTQR